MKFDIRVKILLIIFANYILLKRLDSIYSHLLVALFASLFLIEGKKRKAFKYLKFYVLFNICDYLLVNYFSSTFIAPLLYFGLSARVLFPCLMSGSFLVSNLDTSKAANSLRKWFFSETLIFVILIMLQFLSNIKKDYRDIKDACFLKTMFVRRYEVLIHPLKYYQFIVIPLIMTSLRNGQELTMAILCKGIDLTKKPVSFKEANLKKFDYLVIIGLVFALTYFEVFYAKI